MTAPPDRSRSRSAIAALATGIGAVTLVLIIWSFAPSGDPLGSEDFVAYWAAFDIASDGRSPYDLGEIWSVQAPLRLDALDEAQPFLNPPWLLVVLAPVLGLPFVLASAVWFVVNLGAGVAIAWIGWRILQPDGSAPPPLALAGSLLFLPFLETLMLGQLSALVALVALAAVHQLLRGRDVAAGVLLGLLSCKPQTLLILLLCLGVHVLWTRRWRLAGSALATVLALVAAARLFFPTAVTAWDPVDGAPTYLFTASPAAWIRSVFEAGGDVPEWPILLVPAVGLAAAVPWAWRHRDDPAHRLISVLAVSYLVAPYAWIFDATVLLPLQTVVFGATLLGDRRARRVAAALVAVQFLALVWRSQPWTAQHHMVWLPAALLVVDMWWERRTGGAGADVASQAEASVVQGSGA